MEPGTHFTIEPSVDPADSLLAPNSSTCVDLAAFFQLSADPCLVLGFDGWLRHANSAALETFGRTAEFLCSAPFLHFIHPDDRATVAEKFQTLANHPAPARFQCRVLRADKRELRVELAAMSHLASSTVFLVAHEVAAPASRPETEPPPSISVLAAFIQASMDGVLLLDDSGTIVNLNGAAERVFATTRDAAIGRPLTDWVHLPASRTSANPNRRLETLAHRLDGSPFPAEVTIARLDSPNEPALAVTIRDLTDRRRAEAEIEKLASFPRFNPEAVLELNSDGAITYFNAAALELARSLGHQHPAALLPTDAAAIARGCLALGQNRLRQETQVEGRTIAVSFFPVTPAGVVHCYASDITIRKLAEDRLAQQAALLDEASDTILVQDLDHRVLYWNRSAERLFGWTSAEVLGCEAVEFLLKPSPAREEARRAVLARSEWSGELECLTRDGTVVLVESRWTLVRDSEGRPKSILTLCHDITEKRRVQDQFLRAQRLESIGTLASGIAHDLNNILSPIMMSVNLLQERFTDEPSARLLETLRVGVHRGADMVRQILAFTRGQEGCRSSVHVKPLVSEIAKILGVTFPKNITLRTNVARDLWSVEADATQIYQVLMNLCVNARDAMPKGGVLRIDAANVTLDAGSSLLQEGFTAGPYLALTVADTGEGIAEDLLKKIWEPYFTMKPSGVGTGLGLPTVAKIIKAHNGFIHTRSAPGEGTTFAIHLPAQPAAATTLEKDAPAATFQGCGERILVIDDERAFQEIIRAIFAKYGYRVLTASDGTEAVALFAQHRDDIDLVVTDMEMPHLDGPATINALRRLNPHVPIIAASGYSEKERQAEQLTGAEFLLKPFTAEKLLAVVERSLRARQSTAAHF